MNADSHFLLHDISHIGDYNSIFKNDYKRLAYTKSQYQKSSNSNFFEQNEIKCPTVNAKQSTPKNNAYNFYKSSYPLLENSFGDQQENYFTKEFEKAESYHNYKNNKFRDEYFQEIQKYSASLTNSDASDHCFFMKMTGKNYKRYDPKLMKIEKKPQENDCRQLKTPIANTSILSNELDDNLTEINHKIEKTQNFLTIKGNSKKVEHSKVESESILTFSHPKCTSLKSLPSSNSLQDRFSIKSETSPPQTMSSVTQIAPGKSRVTVIDYGDSSDDSLSKEQESVFLDSPFFLKSNFVNVPPTIKFTNDHREVASKFKKYLKRFKWKLTPITPIVIRNCILCSNFTLTNNSKLWIGTWAKNIKAHQYKSIEDYQKFNHFPMSYQIGRKDCLYRNLNRMASIYGVAEFSFLPASFILPADMKKLEKVCSASKFKWIIKPSASAKGKGIRVINHWKDVPKGQTCVIQKYITNPLLINKNKFDLRIYVYITCFHPLRAYISPDGLARFATANYTNKSRSLKNNFIHLTNYSLNSKNCNYDNPCKPALLSQDDPQMEPHKWSLYALWNYLRKHHPVNPTFIWNDIKDLIIKTIVTAERSIGTMVSLYSNNAYCCHELFGFDILLDEKFKVWLLEVNISPSLHTKSQLDKKIKSQLVIDVLNTAGFRVPDASQLRSAKNTDYVPHTSPPVYCMNKNFHQKSLAADEKEKQIYYSLCHTESQELSASILDCLTPADVRVLVESVDERLRCGHLEVLFPTKDTAAYLKYFEGAKYYTLLLHTWLIEHQQDPAAGMKMLNDLCRDGVHLQKYALSNKQKWKPPAA